MHKMRDSVHLDFNRYGDLLLDLFRRPSRPLCNHLNPCVGNIRVGFDRQSLERDDAPGEKNQGDTENNEAIVESEIDKRTDHYCSAVFWNSSAFVTTCWAGAIPETISCKLPGSICPAVTARRRNL